jgi:flavin-dependent dehydrogenase
LLKQQAWRGLSCAEAGAITSPNSNSASNEMRMGPTISCRLLKRRSEGTDVAVIGAGPAGATAARLLAEWGHSVALVSRPPERRSLAESLPPSIRKLLAHVGMLKRVERAGFLPAAGNTAWWGEARARVESFAGPAGFQVLRADFDRLLLEAARRAGVRGVEANVARVDLEEPELAEVFVSRARRLKARLVLDCSGRAGVIARRFRVKDRRLMTVALNGVWRHEGDFPGVEPTHTLVESYRDGWAWSVPLSRERRHVAFMIDPRPGARYAEELAKTTQLRRLLEGATLVEKPWTCDASVYAARAYSGERFLLVGDAGSFLDPMSSFGVKKALASAWMAAVVVNTCLRHPERGEAALQLFDAREREMATTYERGSARYAGVAAARHASPFWTRRARAEVERAGDDAELRAAFERLKSAGALSFHLAESVEIARAPEVRGREVVLEEAVAAPGLAPIRYLRGVQLPALARLAPRHGDVARLFDEYNRRTAQVSLAEFLSALSFLVARQVLLIR